MAKEKMFQYMGYSIPMDLVYLTGGGPDDWDRISKDHMHMYSKYTPILPDDFIIDIGCGVGREAFQLFDVLSNKGKYIGIDIIRPSIEWCQDNITPKHKNFTFRFYDIKSQIHNGEGTIKTNEIKLPAKDGTVDRIVLHSVFTHMFEEDIMHYLKEFRRVLKPDGLVLASFFVVDQKALDALAKGLSSGHRHPLSFKYKLNKDTFINDETYPEGAIGYTPKKIKSMLRKAGLALHGRHVHRGVWSGITEASNGQDILILEPVSRAEATVQSTQPLKFTAR